MDSAAIISIAAGVILGGIITLCVSRRYYKKATADLDDKVERLERLITLMALYLKRDGVLKDVEIKDGVLKSYTQTINPGFSPSEERSFGITATQGDPPEGPEGADGDPDLR